MLSKNLKYIDGRVRHVSKRNKIEYNEEIRPLNSLNVYSNSLGICLTSEMIDEKLNEIPAVVDIFDRIDITNSIITWDALNTQVNNIEK